MIFYCESSTMPPPMSLRQRFQLLHRLAGWLLLFEKVGDLCLPWLWNWHICLDGSNQRSQHNLQLSPKTQTLDMTQNLPSDAPHFGWMLGVLGRCCHGTTYFPGVTTKKTGEKRSRSRQSRRSRAVATTSTRELTNDEKKNLATTLY